MIRFILSLTLAANFDYLSFVQYIISLTPRASPPPQPFLLLRQRQKIIFDNSHTFLWFFFFFKEEIVPLAHCALYFSAAYAISINTRIACPHFVCSLLSLSCLLRVNSIFPSCSFFTRLYFKHFTESFGFLINFQDFVIWILSYEQDRWHLKKPPHGNIGRLHLLPRLRTKFLKFQFMFRGKTFPLINNGICKISK